jgi:hypothetical protein
MTNSWAKEISPSDVIGESSDPMACRSVEKHKKSRLESRLAAKSGGPTIEEAFHQGW